jgi:hypothetical protein
MAAREPQRVCPIESHQGNFPGHLQTHESNWGPKWVVSMNL